MRKELQKEQSENLSLDVIGGTERQVIGRASFTSGLAFNEIIQISLVQNLWKKV